MRHRKSGEGIHHKKNVFALIFKILRDRCRNQRAFHPQHRRLIRCRNHKDAPFQSLFPEIFLDKLPDLPASLAHKGDHIDIRFYIFCDHPKQRALSNAASGENPATLSFADRIQTVDRFHPEVQRIGDRRTIQWIDICIIYIIMSAGLKRAKRIDRLPRCVDNSSPEELTYRNL